MLYGVICRLMYDDNALWWEPDISVSFKNHKDYTRHIDKTRNSALSKSRITVFHLLMMRLSNIIYNNRNNDPSYWFRLRKRLWKSLKQKNMKTLESIYALLKVFPTFAWWITLFCFEFFIRLKKRERNLL